MEPKNKCEKCGAEMAEGVTTCPACGHTAGQEMASEAPSTEAAA